MPLTLRYVNEVITCLKSDLRAELLVDKLALVLVPRGPALLKSLLYLQQGSLNLVQRCKYRAGCRPLGIKAHHNLAMVLIQEIGASCCAYLIISDLYHIIYLSALECH